MAVGAAVVVNLPFVIGLRGSDVPGWLTSSWQVSATLVGLGIAVVVFLLQAAGSQSLSSDTTYRSLLAYTGLVWPATMALAYLVGVAIVERFDGGSSASACAWAETWAVGAFVVQVVAFGVSFARAVPVVSPAGVRRVLGQSFKDTMRQAVHSSLRRKVMSVFLAQACRDRVSYGLWLTRGKPLLPTAVGVIYDVDLRLPVRLDGMKLGERVTLMLAPGRIVGPDAPLAKLEGVRGGWIEHLVRRAVVIAERDAPPSPEDVFEDVLDVARRALAIGSAGNLKSALRLVIECLGDLPDAYAVWGAKYASEYVREPLSENTEDRIVRSLSDFSEEVFRSGRAQATTLMAEVADGLVDAGLREDAALLVTQATSLWRRQLQTAHEANDASVEQALHEKIGRLAALKVLVQQGRLEDRDKGMSERLDAQPGLRLLFRHQILVLKHYLDAGEIARFNDAWSHWVAWGQHWTPEHDVEDLEFRVKAATGSDRRGAQMELEAASALLAAKVTLVEVREQLMFALGAWALDRKRNGKLSAHDWDLVVPYVVGTDSSAQAAARLLRSVWTTFDSAVLEGWQLRDADVQPGWQPADPRLVAGFWATLLLVRSMPVTGQAPDIDLGLLASQVGPDVLANLDKIESESSTWESSVGGSVPDRVKFARLVVERAMERQAATDAQRLADAVLDGSKIDEYAALQRRAYEDGDYLRKLLLKAGAVESVPRDGPDPEAHPAALLPKRMFTDIDGPEVLVAVTEPAKELVVSQLEAAYTAVEEGAQRWEGGGATAAASAIAALRASGRQPDAVLVPRDFSVRVALGQERHPEWAWAGPVEPSRHRATLCGVPVYECGPPEARSLLVCELGASVHKLERRPTGDSPVLVQVDSIDERRAAELLDAGNVPPGVADEREAQSQALQHGYVSVVVAMDADWRPAGGDPASWRIELPAAEERRGAI